MVESNTAGREGWRWKGPRRTGQPTASGARRLIHVACLVLAGWSGPLTAQNLINNPNFDTDIDDWIGGAGLRSHDSGEGSISGPGSMQIATLLDVSRARQCLSDVSVSTTYAFGADFRLQTDNVLNVCRIELIEFTGENCDGSFAGAAEARELLPDSSSTYVSLDSTFTSSATTGSIQVELYCGGNFQVHTVNWDDVYLATETPPSETYHLLTGFRDVMMHMPGDDGLLGTGDDLIAAEPTTIQGSDPNYRAAYSVRSGKIFGVAAEPGLADGHNRVRYLEGTLEYVPGLGIVDSDLRETGSRQGQGLDSGSGPEGRSYLSGEVMVFDAPFGTAGVDYVDDVLIPKAQQLGASSLLFADLAGDRPSSSNHPNGLPTRFVIAAVQFPSTRGAARRSLGSSRGAADTVDLVVTKTVNLVGQQSPGTGATYTLRIENAGAGTATGVRLLDQLPDGVAYVSNDCSAPAPSEALWSWDVGVLGPGAITDCDVTVSVDGAVNFDVHNAAFAYAEQLDDDLDDNVGEVVIEVFDGAGEGIEQPPNQVTGFLSDQVCAACGGGNQAIADAFKVDTEVEICGVDFYGGYNDNVPFADDFQILIYNDRRATPGQPGVPGQPIAAFQGGLLIRLPLGQQVTGGFDEYRYTLANINPTIVLPRGRYWLVIINNSSTSGAAGDWFWSSGAGDALGRSVPGVVFNPNFDAGSRGWGPNRNLETAFDLCLEGGSSGGLAIFSDGFESGDTLAWSVP